MTTPVKLPINGTGTLSVTQADEIMHSHQIHKNIRDESWKYWPNRAGFENLEEIRGPIPLQIEGSIPAWAAGSLYRTGPGVNAVESTSRGTQHVSHWFDGFAHTHKFEIIAPGSPSGEVSVTYSSRRQSDSFVQQVKDKGWVCGITAGQRADPCIGIFAKAMSLFAANANINVVVLPNFPGLGDKAPAAAGQRTGTTNLYLSTDTATLQEIHPDTLEPLRYTSQAELHPKLTGRLSSSHSKVDHETGDRYNYNLAFGRNATYRVFRVNASTNTTDILATIQEPEANPAYIHSFFLTENYVVLCIPSSHLGWKGLKILWEYNLFDAIKPFNDKALCRWYVVDRRRGNGVVARFSTPASFFFHSVNAFEETFTGKDGTEQVALCLDSIRYKNLDVISRFYYDIILNRDNAAKNYFLQSEGRDGNLRLVRYRFEMPRQRQGAQGRAIARAEEVFSIPAPHAGELPTMNKRYACRPYRFVYGVSSRGLSTFVDCIVKTDLQTRSALIWSGPRGHTPGEPIFVANPGGSGVDEEDSGILLSVVLDGTMQQSYLLCLDAHTMTELGRASAKFPMPMDFHGTHMAAKK